MNPETGATNRVQSTILNRIDELSCGREFVMSEIATKKAPAAYPDGGEIVRICGELARIDLMEYWRDDEKVDKFLRQRMPEWTLWVYPYTRPDRVFNVFYLQWPWTLLDDVFAQPEVRSDIDTVRKLRDQYFTALVNPEVVSEFIPARMLSGIFHSISGGASESLSKRFMNDQIILLDTLVEEALRYGKGQIPDDFEQYLKLRQLSSFGVCSADLAEYAAGIDMTLYLQSSEPIRRATLLALDYVTLTNDLFSFPKEREIGDPLNSVFILMTEGMSLQESVNQISNRMHSIEDALYRIAADATSVSRDGGGSNIRTYLDALLDMIGGTLQFHRESTRHHGDNYTWKGVTSGRMTIVPGGAREIQFNE